MVTDKAEDDKRVKKALLINLLINTITKECASSSHDILQKIYAAITSNDGSKLEATILSGGSTNYSYKVYVDKHPELRIFAKLCVSIHEDVLISLDPITQYLSSLTITLYAV